MNLRLLALLAVVTPLATQRSCKIAFFNPAALTFAPQIVSKAVPPSSPQTARFMVIGGSASIKNVASANGSYSEVNNCPIAASLQSGQSCGIDIRFRPQKLGANSGSVNVTYSFTASTTALRGVSLSGLGIMPIVSLLDSSGNSKADIFWRDQAA